MWYNVAVNIAGCKFVSKMFGGTYDKFCIRTDAF
jgi:hypothetical protein